MNAINVINSNGKNLMDLWDRHITSVMELSYLGRRVKRDGSQSCNISEFCNLFLVLITSEAVILKLKNHTIMLYGITTSIWHFQRAIYYTNTKHDIKCFYRGTWMKGNVLSWTWTNLYRLCWLLVLISVRKFSCYHIGTFTTNIIKCVT
jgi:hypothetical protein